MSETTDIEKKSLEAHVELCAERYRFLEDKLETMDEKISAMDETMKKMYECISELRNRRNDQVIQWTGAGIVGLLAIISWLLTTYVFK